MRPAGAWDVRSDSVADSHACTCSGIAGKENSDEPCSHVVACTCPDSIAETCSMSVSVIPFLCSR